MKYSLFWFTKESCQNFFKMPKCKQADLAVTYLICSLLPNPLSVYMNCD